ncbi:Predicted esterase of the alpha/beta hydrolase fold [Bordetella ansorpii]|uniref:Predicted esterase of the alpha/beta hydrolase fold n=2 Tax=Bordetella ansorpii TaxID=288768 RepID=A0A157M9F0_9BORD|nr:Predicted esterase of the alpha/beta hydrolase fold [Bordetella ansorpii]
MQLNIYSFALFAADGMIPRMRLQPIIIPGWKDSGPAHWQTLWEQSLPHAVRVRQQSWSDPHPATWHAAVAAAVDAAACPALLIAHSLGCLAVASLPVPLHSRVAGALLVAPADVERTELPQCLRAFAPMPRQSLSFQSVVVVGDDDPYCALQRAEGFARDWGSRLVVVPSGGHLNADSGLNDWPAGLKLLTSLRRRATWRMAAPLPKVPAVPV